MELTYNTLIRINKQNRRKEIKVYIDDEKAFNEIINSFYLGKFTAQNIFMEWLEWSEKHHFEEGYGFWLIVELKEKYNLDEKELKGYYPLKHYEWAKNNVIFDNWNELEKFIVERSLEKAFFAYMESYEIDYKKILEPLAFNTFIEKIENYRLFEINIF